MTIPPTKETPPAAGVKVPPLDSPQHDEGLLDQALAETFPASDPISPAYEARMQAEEEARARAQSATWSRRLRRAAPSLIAFGAAALVLLTVPPRRRGH